jgi:hypothetical protein
LLLVVLALLAIFGLIAVAFVVLSTHAKRGAATSERIDRVIDPPERCLHQAFMQVVRGPTTDSSGTPNPASVMGAHSLLETMYGTNTASISTGIISGSTATCGSTSSAGIGQMWRITAGGAKADEIARYGGCVLTISSGTTGYQSTRIVGVDLSNPAAPAFFIPAFPSGASPSGGSFTISGVPFGGTGFGYRAGSNDLDDTRLIGGKQCPLALLPNHVDNRNPAGGANPDYTAADFQHVLLAAQVYPAGTSTTFGNGTPVPGMTVTQTLPSLHRPALVRYWAAQVNPTATFDSVSALASAAQGIPNDLMRAIVLRPLPALHPNFTGSNPTYTGAMYTSGFNPCWDGGLICDQTTHQPLQTQPVSWDVDNDGDGVPDSVWVDLGMPVRATADGRLYKPLFAILCVDLDGRINLNAHGSGPQRLGGSPASPTGTTLSFADNKTPSARGVGVGPGETSPLAALSPGGNTATGNTVYSRLIGGTVSVGSVTYSGRYGSSGLPGTAGTVGAIMANKWFEYGGNYWSFATPSGSATASVNDAGSFGSPPDVFGLGVVGLDQAGRPVYAGSKQGMTYYGFGGSITNNPYEFNLSPNVARGSATSTLSNPFCSAELERVLRPYDRDAPSLPGRLAALTSSSGNSLTDSVLITDRNLQKAVTTDGWDVPCPGVSAFGTTTVVDRLTARLKATGAPQSEVPKMVSEMLSPDVLAGLKMDIDRPFGNGRDYDAHLNDDSTNAGVVDAPGTKHHVKLYKTDLQTENARVSYDGIGYDDDATKPRLARDALEARQLEARYLYVLVFLLADRSSLRTQFAAGATAEADKAENAARAIAQWAVNVVDMRDRDGIMTRFDYDPNYAYDDPLGHPLAKPDAGGNWTAWNPPGDAAHQVWGCERPELLISEALAFHDRRSQDTDKEQVDSTEGGSQEKAGTTTETDAKKRDTSFDQVFQPQGSLFVELFNPWSGQEPRSGDLYTSPIGGVDLAKATPPDAASKTWPVWRLIIVDQAHATDDPDDPAKSVTIERAVYFAGTTTAKNLPGDCTVNFRPTEDTAMHTVRIAPVLPGRYAVIGPGEPGDTNQSVTYLGFKSGEDPGSVTLDKTRRIVLRPPAAVAAPNKPNPDTANQVQVFGGSTTGSGTVVDDLNGLTIQKPTAVVINSPRRLSISEPPDGYPDKSPDPNNQPNGSTYSPTGGYSPAWDIPLDDNRVVANPVPAEIKRAIYNNGRTDGLKVVHLQRLANPLRPYNNTPSSSDYNPYRTIDSMPIDLTAFNGIETSDDPEVTKKINERRFYARQRGQNNGGTNDLWRQEPWGSQPKVNTARPPADLAASTFNLKWPLSHSLGFLDDPFGAPQATPQQGDPASPFPWLTWPNRPYVSPLELLQVTFLRSSQLLSPQFPQTSNRAYNTSQGGKLYEEVDKPFPHLLNPFVSGSVGSPNSELHRVLAYLRAPSPFVGTEIWINPTNAARLTNVVHPFHPPFNRISTYREPGKININTIYQKEVFRGLMAGSGLSTTEIDTLWSKLVRSRRGDSNTDVLTATTLPTEFAHPFRSFAGASLIPTLTGDSLKPTREINATLLREDPTAAGQPLFRYASTSASDNTDRNPYFRYRPLQRLENLVTTRSNVYAVWITVGYFEVTPWNNGTADADHPDGYQLGRELGLDTGELERHRAFYIFDRSIPVGFQRGRDLNVEKAILVKRFIE